MLEGLAEANPVLGISMAASVGVLLGDKIWAVMHAYRVHSKGMSTNYLYAQGCSGENHINCLQTI